MQNMADILEKAKASAGSLPAPLAVAAMTPVTMPGAAYNMNEDAFLNPGGMEVDSYIQVKDAGIKLSKDWNGYIDEFTVDIDLSEVQFFMGIRKEVGSNVSYAKTYDGATTQRGENFAQIVAQFKAESQKPADPYRGADIPMSLVGDYADPKKTGKALSEGQVVGLSTSITGFKPWASFHKRLKGAGVEGVVRVRVTHKARKNAAGQDYGICEYELVSIDA